MNADGADQQPYAVRAVSDSTPPATTDDGAPTRRMPSWLRVPLVLSIGTLLALLAGEVGVRTLGLAPPPRGESKALRVVCRTTGDAEAPGIGRVLVPNTEERHPYAAVGDAPAREVLYRINNLGLRGPDAERMSQPGTVRVCALGDSFTFGTAINESETWPSALGEELNDPLNTRSYEVLNCGMEAINLGQEVALLENRVARLDPDVVVLCIYINDASGRGIDAPELSAGAARRRAWVERLGLTSGVWAPGEERTRSQRITMGLRRTSHLIDWLAQRAYHALYASISTENYRRDWSVDSPGWTAARKALERAKELSLLADFELVVTMYPVLAGLEDDYPYAQEHARVAEACRNLSLPYVDLVQPLSDLLDGRPSKSLHAHAHDAHPNGEANRRAAEVLAGVIR